jgi:cell division protein FtsW (lipid II flippase)
MNRFVVIGWNVVNVAILVLLLVRQIGASRNGETSWIARLHGVFKLGTSFYLAWALLLALALPWIF